MPQPDRAPGTFRVIHIRLARPLHKRLRHFAIENGLDTARAVEALLTIALDAVNPPKPDHSPDTKNSSVPSCSWCGEDWPCADMLQQVEAAEADVRDWEHALGCAAWNSYLSCDCGGSQRVHERLAALRSKAGV